MAITRAQSNKRIRSLTKKFEADQKANGGRGMPIGKDDLQVICSGISGLIEATSFQRAADDIIVAQVSTRVTANQKVILIEEALLAAIEEGKI